MKIFNWVHRKFHQHNVDRYTVSPKQDHSTKTEVAEQETVITETDTKALLQLDGVALTDVWKDCSILSIGTLGYEYSITDEEEEEDFYFADAEEQLKQMAIEPFRVSLQKAASEKSETETTISEISAVAEEITPDTAPLLLDNTSERKRVTLADLLLEEKAVHTSGDKEKMSVDLGKSEKISAGIEKKGLLSFGKKKKDKKDRGEEPGPKRKIQRMISKMLKKKIYPADLEGKFNGKDESRDAPKKSTDNIATEHHRNRTHKIGMASLA